MPTLTPDGRRLNGRGSKWITPKRRLAIYRRDGWRCRLCGKWLQNQPKRSRHLDHIVPRCRGGGNESVNLRLTCASCNSRRQHRSDGVAP